MKKNVYRLFLCCLVSASLAAGCGSGRKAVPSAAPGDSGAASVVDEEMLGMDGLMIDAKIQQEIGNYDEARQRYVDLTNKYPAYAAAYYELGGLMLEQGYADSALLLTQKAVSLDKGNLWYRLQLTEVYDYQHDYRSLCGVWEDVVAMKPEVLEYYYELSDAYIKANEGEKAVKALERIESRYGVSEEVSLRQKEIWEAMGRHDMALKEIEQIAKAMPQESKYAAMMAEVYMRKKDYRRAKEYYDQILANHPDDNYIHFSLANYYQVTGDGDKGMEELSLGLKQPGLSCIEKLHVMGSYFGGSELSKSDMHKAEELTEALFEQCPEEGEVTYFYGRLLVFDERYDKAVEVLKHSLTQDSSGYETWELLLVSMDAAGSDRQEMMDYARRAASLFPLHTLPNYLIGMQALMDKDYAQAKKFLTRCESMGFRHGYLEKQTYDLLGDCHYWMGEYDKAWRYFDKSLRIDSTDVHTLNNYAYFMAEQGVRLNQAEQMSKKTVEAEPDNATYLDTYAWILHKLGRDKEALPYMERAMHQADEDRETLREHLTIIRKSLGM